MGSITSIGLSALTAYQRAIQTTGNNVANVNTPGYSRQRVDLSTQLPENIGKGYIGSGVQVTNIQRQYDEFLARQMRAGQSATSELGAYHKYAVQVDNLIAHDTAGLDPAIQSFFDAVQDLSGDPSSIPVRELVLAEGRTLADRFRSLDRLFEDSRTRVHQDMGNIVKEINDIAGSIARINQDITGYPGVHEGRMPNDLLDQRDQLINRLAEYVNVSTSIQDNGAVNVYIGTGQALVLNNRTQPMKVVDSPLYPNRKEIAYDQGSSDLIISSQITGGALGGLLRVRDEVLDPGQKQLGLVALGVAAEVNRVHRLGVDLNGNPGGDFFSLSLSSAYTLQVTGTAALTTDDYRLDYDGASYTLTRLSDNVSVTGALPQGMDGFQITATSLAAGESTLVRPAYEGGGALGMALTDARTLAAGLPGGGISDNRNALALADLQQSKALLGGTGTFQDTFSNYVATNGSRTHQAEVNLRAQEGLLQASRDQLQGVQGVNLDEEAANLVRFQQAYQAAAQVISVARNVFDSLIASVGR